VLKESFRLVAFASEIIAAESLYQLRESIHEEGEKGGRILLRRNANPAAIVE
jgi:hypothetical protein